MRLLGRCQRRLLERIGDLERRQAYRADGSTSMLNWVMEHLHVGYPTARDYVAVATELAQLSALSEALSSGAVSFDQLRVLVRVATPGNDAELARRAPRWSLAQTESYVRLEETRRADAQRAAADAARRQAESEAAARGSSGATGGEAPGPTTLSASAGAPPPGAPGRPCGGPGAPPGPKVGTLRLRHHHGGGTVEGWLAAEDFAALESVLMGMARSVERDPVTGGFVALPERLARALMDLVRAGGGAGGAEGAVVPPTVVVHCDVGLLSGEADGTSVGVVEGVGPVAAEVIRRLACDAQLRLALEADGVTLDLGRARRSPSARLGREVLRRDQTCRFPGCGARRFLEVHHVVWWDHGGATDLDNLAAHCARDHHRIHHGGWRVEGHANAELRYTSPEGRTLVSVPDPSWRAPTRRRTDRPQR